MLSGGSMFGEKKKRSNLPRRFWEVNIDVKHRPATQHRCFLSYVKKKDRCCERVEKKKIDPLHNIDLFLRRKPMLSGRSMLGRCATQHRSFFFSFYVKRSMLSGTSTQHRPTTQHRSFFLRRRSLCKGKEE